jgi:hypothetical protein
MWRQLKGAFDVTRLIFVPRLLKMDGYTFEQAETLSDALDMLPDGTQRCFLEPLGAKPIKELPIGGDVALILGSTSKNNLNHARDGETYRIDTPAGPGKAHLYGINAAAIALAVRYRQ